MKYCRECVMPNTRPGIWFDDSGVCCACLAYKKRAGIDFKKRMTEFKALCDKYRGMNGAGPDCMIAVSGGKDSHFQVYVMKELMGMNPILVTVEDNFTMTEAGKHNLKNISEAFGCNVISMKPDIKTQKILMKKTFEKYGKPTWFIDRMIYTYPMHMAIKFNTPLLVYGENVSYEYGGADAVETYSANGQLLNGVASDIDHKELLGDGITEKELYFTNAPSIQEMKKLDSIYVSYFMPWNSYSNYLFAKSRGFKDLTHEWDRTHHAENFDQIDSYAYLVHSWMKYPKFGHASATDYAARFVRYGLLTRDQAIQIVKERDHNLDTRSIDDFCAFCGYSRQQFYAIIEKFYSKELFTKDKFGKFVLRSPVWKK